MNAPTPYPFQTEILDDLRGGWKETSKQLVVSPTGSGKTAIFSWVTGEFVNAGHRVLILVNQDELVTQTLAKLQSFASLPAEVEKAERHASLDARVVVGSVQTMYRTQRLERWPENHFGLVIADEADQSITKTWQSVLTRFDKHSKVAGFTATPWRTDQRNLGCYYERIIEKDHLKSLIVKGYLCPLRIEKIPVKLDLSSVHVSEGDYDKNELDELLRPHLLKIAETIRDRAAFRKTLVFLPLVKTAQSFTDICRSLGMDCESIHGKDPQRDVKWDRFQANGDCVMANSQLLTRGVDDPAIDCVVPCRPTKSVTLYFQMVGRATRLSPGKLDALLMDFLYQSSHHLICRPAHLVAKDEFEADQISEMIDASAGLPGDVAEQLDLVDLAATASSQREEALRKRLEALKANKLKVISPEEFALMHHSMDLAEYQPVMPSDSLPPTPDQVKWLKKARVNPKDGSILLHYAPAHWKPFDLSKITNRGQASKTLGLIFAKKSRAPILASQKQRALMERMGYGDASSCTAEEARAFFANRRGPRERQFAI